MHGRESADARRADARLGTSRHHHVGLAVTDEVESLREGKGRRGAGCGSSVVGTAQAETDGNQSGAHVRHHLGDEERGEVRSLLRVTSVVVELLLEGARAADADTYHSAEAVQVFLLKVEAGVVHGLHRCSHRKLGIGVDLAEFLTVEVLLGLKVLHLAGKGSLEEVGVEVSDRSSAAHSCQKVFPVCFNVIADRCDSTHSCDYNSTKFHDRCIGFNELSFNKDSRVRARKQLSLGRAQNEGVQFKAQRRERVIADCSRCS